MFYTISYSINSVIPTEMGLQIYKYVAKYGGDMCGLCCPLNMVKCVRSEFKLSYCIIKKKKKHCGCLVNHYESLY